MKIALLLTGLPRAYEKTFMTWKYPLFHKHDIDIYISSWDTIETDYNPHKMLNQPRQTQLTKINTQKILDFYGDKVKKYVFTNYENFYTNRFPSIQIIDRDKDVFKISQRAKQLGSFWVERLRDQYYIVKQGWNLIEEDYDYYMRLRFDIQFYSFDIIPNNQLVIPVGIYKNFLLQDHLAYGTKQSMNTYCTIFDHIEQMYTDHNIDIASAEIMYQFYLDTYMTTSYFVDNSCKYRIVRT